MTSLDAISFPILEWTKIKCTNPNHAPFSKNNSYSIVTIQGYPQTLLFFKTNFSQGNILTKTRKSPLPPYLFFVEAMGIKKFFKKKKKKI